MLERLDVWLAIFTLGALAWFELRLGRFVAPLLGIGADLVERGKEEIEERRRRRPMRLRPRPIRGAYGRFDGSLPAAPVVPLDGSERSEGELGSESGTALERHGTGGTDGTEVPGGTMSPAEIALIALRLGQGMTPAKVAKSLPGYSGRKYAEYMEKVEIVQQEIAGLGIEEQAA